MEKHSSPFIYSSLSHSLIRYLLQLHVFYKYIRKTIAPWTVSQLCIYVYRNGNCGKSGITSKYLWVTDTDADADATMVESWRVSMCVCVCVTHSA